MTYRNRDGRVWLWLAAAFLSPFHRVSPLRAMPDGPRLAVLRDRSRTSRLRPSGAIAIAEQFVMLTVAAFLGFALAVQL
jgi:hypothetical protein